MKPPSDPFALGHFLPYLLASTSSRVLRVFARRDLAMFGLSVPEWRVVAMIGERGTIGATEISRHSDMDKVKVSRAVAGLMRRGLIRRAVDPADGRAFLLSFTRRGRNVHERIMPRALTLAATLSAAIPPEEMAVFRSVLARLEAEAARLEG